MASWAVRIVIEPSWVRVRSGNVDEIALVPIKRKTTARYGVA
jgi:hypothetical protein